MSRQNINTSKRGYIRQKPATNGSGVSSQQSEVWHLKHRSIQSDTQI